MAIQSASHVNTELYSSTDQAIVHADAVIAACQRWWHIRLREEAEQLLFSELGGPTKRLAHPTLASELTSQGHPWGDDGALVVEWFEQGDALSEFNVASAEDQRSASRETTSWDGSMPLIWNR